MPRIAALVALTLPLTACAAETSRSDLGQSRAGLAASVHGKLEAVSCDSLIGWAQDSAAPDAPIAIEVTFDAPFTEKSDGAFAADLHRADLCQSLGSCAHAFDIAPPLSLFDGEPHGVFAYGDDVALADKAPLDGNGAVLVCPPPSIVGTKRLLPNAAAQIAWRLNLFWHAVTIEDEAIEAIPEAEKLPETPVLARSDDGSPEVWLLDGAFRRSVSDPAVRAHWRFAEDAILTRPSAEIDALELGPPLTSRPMIVQSSFDQMYLIDEALDGSTNPHSSEPGPTQPIGSLSNGEHAPEADSATCAARIASTDTKPGDGFLIFAFGLLLFSRRSRNACK